MICIILTPIALSSIGLTSDTQCCPFARDYSIFFVVLKSSSNWITAGPQRANQQIVLFTTMLHSQCHLPNSPHTPGFLSITYLCLCFPTAFVGVPMNKANLLLISSLLCRVLLSEKKISFSDWSQVHEFCISNRFCWNYLVVDYECRNTGFRRIHTTWNLHNWQNQVKDACR